MKGCQLILKIVGWLNIIGGIFIILLGLVAWFAKIDFTESFGEIQEIIKTQLGPALEIEIIEKYFLIVLIIIGVVILIYGLLARMAGKDPKKSLPVLVLSFLDLLIGLVEWILGSSIGSYAFELGMSLTVFVAALVVYFRSRT